MAERYAVTVPQLCIRYTIQLDTVSLPKTANPDHMRSNAQVDYSGTGGRLSSLLHGLLPLGHPDNHRALFAVCPEEIGDCRQR